MVYVVLALIVYTAVILTATAASRHADSKLVAVIQATLSVVIPALMIILGSDKKSFMRERFGLTMAVLSGFGIGLFAWAMAKAYAEIKVGIVAPVVFGGAIFLATLCSYFIFKEKLSLLETTGLGIMGIGLGVLIYARVR